MVFDLQLIQRGIVPWWTQALFWACFCFSFSRPSICLPKFSVPSVCLVKFSVLKTDLFKTIRVSIRQCQVPIIDFTHYNIVKKLFLSLFVTIYIFLHLTAMYSSTFGKGWVGRSCLYLLVWVSFGSFSLRELTCVCTVCIWRCEHARFCVEVFYALYINFHSFIHSFVNVKYL